MTSNHARPLLFHKYTGLQALGLRKDGRPIWPVAGGNGEGTGTPNRSPFLTSLYAERHDLEAFIERTVQGAMTGGTDGGRRDLSQTEQETLSRTRTRIGELDSQIKPLEEFEQLRSAGDTAARNFPQRTPAAQPGGGEQTGRTGLGAQ
ncbi:MAG TPA: hypothetical protein VIQ30_22230, partial [Pseudonocardia sp.]